MYSLSSLNADGYSNLLRDLLQREDGAQPPAPPGIKAPSASAKQTPQPQRKRSGSAKPVQIQLNPPALVIDDNEWAFMQALSALFQTPRSVKRFVNTYRILKVTHTELLGQLEPQRLVLTLLAVLIAHPTSAMEWFAQLEGGALDWTKAVAQLQGHTPALHQAMSRIDASWSGAELGFWSARVGRFAPRLISFEPNETSQAPAAEPP